MIQRSDCLGFTLEHIDVRDPVARLVGLGVGSITLEREGSKPVGRNNQ
jgi:hypothetical protein